MRKIVEVIGARSESYLEVHSEAKSAADVSTGGSATAIISSQKSEIFSSTLTHFIETPGSEQSTEQDTQVQSLLIPPDDDSRSYGWVVLVSFKPEVTQEHKDAFLSELKAVDKTFPHVKRAFVGGPSLTDKWSNGFEIGFVSFHDSFEELTRYQALEEHDRITSTFLYSFEKQLCAFDFEIDARDEDGSNIGLLQFLSTKGSDTKTSLREPSENVDSK